MSGNSPILGHPPSDASVASEIASVDTDMALRLVGRLYTTRGAQMALNLEMACQCRSSVLAAIRARQVVLASKCDNCSHAVPLRASAARRAEATGEGGSPRETTVWADSRGSAEAAAMEVQP